MNNLEYLKDIEGKYRDAKLQFEQEIRNIINEKEMIFKDGEYSNETIYTTIKETIKNMQNNVDDMMNSDSVIRKEGYRSYKKYYEEFFEGLELLEKIM